MLLFFNMLLFLICYFFYIKIDLYENNYNDINNKIILWIK